MATGDFNLLSFEVGKLVGLYKSRAVGPRPSGAPGGAPIATATVGAYGITTFTGLDPEPYFATLAPVAAVQILTVDATAGTYLLRLGSDTTVELAYNAVHATVEGALEALPSIGVGNVAVSGGPGDDGGTTPYTIAFQGDRADTPVAAVQFLEGGTPLSGGGAYASVAVSEPGTAGDGRWVSLSPNP